MIIKLFGIFDLIAALIILMHTQVPVKAILVCAFYLLIKGALFIFMEDFASVVDVIVGIYALFLAYNLSIGLLTIVASLFLAQKGLLSLA